VVSIIRMGGQDGSDYTDTHRDFFKQFVQFINTADENLAQQLISPLAKFHVPAQPEPLQGPKGYLMTIAMMRSGFPDIQWTLEEMIAEDDKVAVRYTMQGTHQGEFMGFPATGKSILVQAINFYRLVDNQIVEEYGQPDMFALLRQIGAIPI
jgi:steroid delta-isomerase-like uncharacterized protein